MSWNIFGNDKKIIPEYMSDAAGYDKSKLRKSLAKDLLYDIQDQTDEVEITGGFLYKYTLRTGTCNYVFKNGTCLCNRPMYWKSKELLSGINSGNSKCGTCGNCNTCWYNGEWVSGTVCTFCIINNEDKFEIVEVTPRVTSSVELKKIPEPKEPVDFMDRLKNTIEMEIVDNRIKTIGRDPMFSYTQNEYISAFTRLFSNNNKLDYRIRLFKWGNLSMMGLSLVASIFSDNPIYVGIFITSMINSGEIRRW